MRLTQAIPLVSGDGAAAPDEPADDTATQAEIDDEQAADDEAVDIKVDEAALQTILDDWRTETDLDVFAGRAQHAVGATVSLRVPGHEDIQLASGIDGRNPDTPMPTDGTQRIDRVTRTFVVAIALQLVDEGRLSLDDTVERWLPRAARRRRDHRRHAARPHVRSRRLERESHVRG